MKSWNKPLCKMITKISTFMVDQNTLKFNKFKTQFTISEYAPPGVYGARSVHLHEVKKVLRHDLILRKQQHHTTSIYFNKLYFSHIQTFQHKTTRHIHTHKEVHIKIAHRAGKSSWNVNERTAPPPLCFFITICAAYSARIRYADISGHRLGNWISRLWCLV